MWWARDQYQMKIANGRLYEDFSWEMDVAIWRDKNVDYVYTYFGTYFTHANYHPRLANRPLKMSKPNNGWVLQGCVTCRACKVCNVYSGVSLFPDQLTRAESVEAAQQRVEDVFDENEIETEIKRQKVEGIDRRKQEIFNGNPRVKIR